MSQIIKTSGVDETTIKINQVIVDLDLEHYMNVNNDCYFIVVNDNVTERKFYECLGDLEIHDVYLYFVDEHFCELGQNSVYTHDEGVFAVNDNNQMVKIVCDDCPIENCKAIN